MQQNSICIHFFVHKKGEPAIYSSPGKRSTHRNDYCIWFCETIIFMWDAICQNNVKLATRKKADFFVDFMVVDLIGRQCVHVSHKPNKFQYGRFRRIRHAKSEDMIRNEVRTLLFL